MGQHITYGKIYYRYATSSKEAMSFGPKVVAYRDNPIVRACRIVPFHKLLIGDSLYLDCGPFPDGSRNYPREYELQRVKWSAAKYNKQHDDCFVIYQTGTFHTVLEIARVK